MKAVLLGTVSVLALASAAVAADIPARAPMPVKSAPFVPVVPTWTGFYLGIQGGVASHWAYVDDLDDVGFGGVRRYEDSKVGGFAGVNAGFNLQSGAFVYGIEGDWNWIGAKAGSSYSSPICTPACVPTTSFDVQWLATFRGRLGVTTGSTLFYGTGGVAFGKVENSLTVVFPPIGITNTLVSSSTRTGWTAGGGIEHMFGPNWTARVEGRYVDLGRSSATCIPGSSSCNLIGGGTYRGEFSNRLIMGLVGLDYKF